jgi:hypothetical protein
MAEPTPRSSSDRSTPPPMPRWVKLSAVVVGVLVLVFVILHLLDGAGGHGPGRHVSGQGVAATDPALVTASSATTLG